MIFLGRPGSDSARLIDVAVLAITKVEFVADDWPVHGVGAIRQLAVDDGMGAEILGDMGFATRVPTAAMAIFSVHAEIVRYPYGDVWRASEPQR